MGGIQTTDYLLGIESLVSIDAKYIQSFLAPWSKGGKNVNLKQTLKNQPLLKLLG